MRSFRIVQKVQNVPYFLSVSGYIPRRGTSLNHVSSHYHVLSQAVKTTYVIEKSQTAHSSVLKTFLRGGNHTYNRLSAFTVVKE